MRKGEREYSVDELKLRKLEADIDLYLMKAIELRIELGLSPEKETSEKEIPFSLAVDCLRFAVDSGKSLSPVEISAKHGVTRALTAYLCHEFSGILEQKDSGVCRNIPNPPPLPPIFFNKFEAGGLVGQIVETRSLDEANRLLSEGFRLEEVNRSHGRFVYCLVHKSLVGGES
jgi:hypothetical protein